MVTRTFGVRGVRWSPDNLYRLATRVKRSFIRMDADEVTYPIHVMLRWELEQALFSGPSYAFRLEPGDAYILRTDTGMHRVSPIHEGARRVVINMVWATTDEQDKPLSHETMEALFA